MPSNVLSFNILPLAKPALISPTDSVDTKISDVVLDWDPVAGARTYDVQISDGPTFDPGSTTTATGVQGTRFSPSTTLNNDQFWWRVRAIDLNGQATTWAQTNFGFNRVFEHQSDGRLPHGQLLLAAPSDDVRPVLPVDAGAAGLRLRAASSPTTSTSPVNAARAAPSGTTYAPRSLDDCGYKPTGTTFWMVPPARQALRQHRSPGPVRLHPAGHQLDRRRQPAATFDPSAEVTGMKVSVDGGGAGCASSLCDNVPTTPVFSWDPMPGATSYFVYVGQDNKFTTSVLATKSCPDRRRTTRC